VFKLTFFVQYLIFEYLDHKNIKYFQNPIKNIYPIGLQVIYIQNFRIVFRILITGFKFNTPISHIIVIHTAPNVQQSGTML